MTTTTAPALCIKCAKEATVSVYLMTQGVEITLCKHCIDRVREGKKVCTSCKEFSDIYFHGFCGPCYYGGTNNKEAN